MKSYLQVLSYVRPYWRSALAAIILTVLTTLCGLLIPWPLKFLVDNVLGDQPLPTLLASLLGPFGTDRFSLLLFVVFAGLALALAINLLSTLNEYVQTKLIQQVTIEFRSELFDHVQRLSLGYHDYREPGALIYAVSIEAEIVVNLIKITLPLAQGVLTIVGMFGIVFLINRE